jgi:hypothetical protein
MKKEITNVLPVLREAWESLCDSTEAKVPEMKLQSVSAEKSFFGGDWGVGLGFELKAHAS